jgi:hypothetical protein
MRAIALPPFLSLPASGTASRTMALVARITVLCLLATMAISWKAYVPAPRIFAPYPLWESLNALPEAVNWGVALLYVGLNIWLFIAPLNPRPAVGLLFCILFWTAQDMNRMQPYLYMYSYAIFIVACCGSRKEGGLDALRIMVCGVYFWAGLHKMNVTFYVSTFPWFVSPFFTFNQPGTPMVVEFLAQLIMLQTPYFEALIGVFLLFPKWRRLGTAMAFAMLVVVLLCLGPLGHNWGVVVWPWNLYLFILEVVLFMNVAYNQRAPFLLYRQQLLGLLSIVLFMLAPALAMYQLWYTRLGFKLYSGNASYAEIVFPPEEGFSRMPEYVKNLVNDKHILDVTEWSGRELQNLAYPVPEAFKLGSVGLCPYLEQPKDAILRIYYPPPFYTYNARFEDLPLCPQ